MHFKLVQLYYLLLNFLFIILLYIQIYIFNEVLKFLSNFIKNFSVLSLFLDIIRLNLFFLLFWLFDFFDFGLELSSWLFLFFISCT